MSSNFRNYLIYQAINTINNKIYIGQTSNLKKRIYDHIRASKHKKDNMTFHKAIRKYGIDNFKWEVIYKCEDKLVLNVMETMKIIVNHSHISEGGYNMTWGGEGTSGYKLSNETKEKQRLKKLGIKQTKEHITNRMKWMINYKPTNETKIKMSIIKVGKKNSVEHCKNISLAMLGKKRKPYIKNKDIISRNIDILKLRALGFTYKQIMVKIKVSKATISNVCSKGGYHVKQL